MKEVHCNIKDVCIITWRFSSTCNYACSYCPDHLHDGAVGFPDYDNAVKFVTDIAQYHSHIHIELLGGEPTLWPKLIEFLSELKKCSNIIVEIGTNGSRTTKWWKKYCEAELHMNSVLAVSYHAAWCDPDLFYNNLEVLSEKHNVVANFMLDPDYFDKTRELFERVRDNLAVDCFFKVLRDKFHSSRLVDGYTDEMLDAIRNIPEENKYNRQKFPKEADNIQWPSKIVINGERRNWQEIIIAKEHSFTGWMCSAGYKRFNVDLFGDVWPCNEISYSDDKKRYHLGNINHGNVKIKPGYISCPVDYCPCKLDAVVHKYKED